MENISLFLMQIVSAVANILGVTKPMQKDIKEIRSPQTSNRRRISLYASILIVVGLGGYFSFLTLKPSEQTSSTEPTSPEGTHLQTPPSQIVERLGDKLNSIAEDIQVTKDNTKEAITSINGLKENIDSVLFEFIKKTETKSTDLVKSENVSVNYRTMEYGIEENTSGSATPNDKITMRFSDKLLVNGYGRLAVRASCDVCWMSSIYIYKKDSLILNDNVRLYDADDKEYTTFMTDLPTGQYIVKISDQILAPSFFTVIVEGGQISLYNFKRENPYMGHLAEISFVINRPGNYKFFVNNEIVGTVNPTTDLPKNIRGQRLFNHRVLGNKNYYVRVECLDTLKYADAIKKTDFYLYAATSRPVDIDYILI